MWILRNASDEIVGWGMGEFVLADGQSQEQIGGTVGDYAGRFVVTADKTRIVADGVDEAAVTVRTNTGAGSIDVDVNGVTVPIAMVDGMGTLPGITAEVAGNIVISPADRTVYSAAGEGSIVIQAVEA